MHIDILIKNATIIDGSGSAAYTADIAIAGQSILEIGKLQHLEAETVIDAAGKVVSPGFIDIHSHIDLYMNRDGLPQLFEPFVRQGITTCVTGNCGMGMAPVTDENMQLLINTLGGVGISAGRQFEWRSMDEYLSYADSKGPIVNMAQLIPHGPLRIATMGERSTFAAGEDINRMKEMVRLGMEAGCFGFSSGLMYYPGVFSNTDELIQLNAVCGKYNGRYSTHLRAQCTTFPYAVGEAIEIATKGGTGLQISHFHAKPFFGDRAAMFYHLVGFIEFVNGLIPLPYIPNAALEKGLSMVEAATENGLDFGMDMVPYIMSNTELTAVFPPWAHIGGNQSLLKRIAEDKTWKEIKRDMQNVVPEWPPFGERAWSDNYSKALGWHIIRILSVQTEKNRPLQGMTIVEIARQRRVDPWEAARQITLEEDGMVLIQAGFPSRPWVEKFSGALFAHPQMSVMTDAVLPAHGPPPQAAYGAFPRFLGHYVRELNLLSLEEAIRKMTSLPAERYGIKSRGSIKKGYFADIVILDEKNVQDTSTLEKPNSYPVGIHVVIINGKIVLDGNKYFADANAGRVLRKTV
jgi:N-acyl-D-amino-acid deacylase